MSLQNAGSLQLPAEHWQIIINLQDKLSKSKCVTNLAELQFELGGLENTPTFRPNMPGATMVMVVLATSMYSTTTSIFLGIPSFHFELNHF